MKKLFFLIFSLFLICLIFFFLYSPKKDVVIDGKVFSAEIADNSFERERGLMFRKELCHDCGMLFVFEKQDFHNFWMKNTFIPLDIVFINSNLIVVDVMHLSLCNDCQSYTSQEEFIYALEVNYNTFDSAVIGKKVKIDN